MTEPKGGEAVDYGEPWIKGEMGWIVIAEALGQHAPKTPGVVGQRLEAGLVRWCRAIACVNAMRWIADPEAFVKAADALQAAGTDVAEGEANATDEWPEFCLALDAYRSARGKP